MYTTRTVDTATIRMLILEDNPDDSGLIRRMLRRSNLRFEVKEVASGEEFLAALDSFAPQAILSDHKLHDFSSINALKACREKYPFIPFILVTGSVSEEFAAAIVREGADDYILKDNLERLPTAIEQAIDRQHTDESLYHSESNLRSIFNNTDTGYILLDNEFRVVSYNCLVEEWVKSNFNQPIQLGADVFTIDPESQPLPITTIKETVLAGTIVEYEKQVQVAERKPWYYIRFLPVKGSNGAVKSATVAVSDITEKKAAQLEKEFEQRNLEALINNTRDLMWSVDRNFRLITSNQAFNQVFQAVSGKPIERGADVLPPTYDKELIDRYRMYYSRALAGETFTTIEHTVAPVESWAEMSFYPIQNSGEIIGTACFARDITAKMRAEKELADRERRFRALIENSSDAIVLNDSNASILYQSPSVQRILGYEIEERQGRKVLDYIHPDDYDSFVELYKEVARSPGKPIPFQYRFRHKAGHYVWLEGVLTNLSQDPSVNAFIANYRDVTSRKEAQENLELTLRRFKEAQRIGHMGHWQIDFATKRTTWSDEAYRIYGITPGTVAASEELFLKYVHPEDLERVKSIMGEGVNTLRSFSFVHRIIQDSGAVRTLLSTSQFEFDKANRPTALYGISLDITEITEKERELAAANKELETFIYKTYHDLRAPIASVLGIVNLASREVKDPAAQKYFNMVGDVTHKQNKMLKKLANVMTIRGRELVIAPFDLHQLIAAVSEQRKSLPSWENVELIIENELPETFVGDKEMLHNILYELLENAILYRDTRRAKSSIWIDLKRTSTGFIEIKIEDNGQGIPSYVREQIFEMFFRGNPSSSGSGLGLYLVKNAVSRLGGKIDLQSTEHSGTEFTITLPSHAG